MWNRGGSIVDTEVSNAKEGPWLNTHMKNLVTYSSRVVQAQDVCKVDKHACLDKFYWDEDESKFQRMRSLYAAQGLKGLSGYKPKIPKGFALVRAPPDIHRPEFEPFPKNQEDPNGVPHGLKIGENIQDKPYYRYRDSIA